MREGLAILKKRIEVSNSLTAMFDIIQALIRRDGIPNICVDFELFGKECSSNFNENLKLKSTSPDTKSSLFIIINLLKSELSKFEKTYISAQNNDNDYLQTSAIKKIRNDLQSGIIDVGLFFNRLTFRDNTGSVKGMDYYDVGDEGEYSNDDRDYRHQLLNYHVLEDPAEFQAPQNPQPQPAEDDICIVCITQKRDTVVEPCYHLKFCYSCISILHDRARESRTGVPKCPLCRIPITKYTRAFL